MYNKDAFCIKTQCDLRQIILQSDADVGAISCKWQRVLTQKGKQFVKNCDFIAIKS